VARTGHRTGFPRFRRLALLPILATMPDDDFNESIARMLRELDSHRLAQERQIAEQRARLNHLIDLLVARATLNEGHRRHLDRVARHDAGTERRVRLRAPVDKHAVTGPAIDCAERLHLCKARCCMFNVELTAFDVEEGRLRWKLDEPYLLRRDPDGQCTHIDRGTFGCMVYEVRPATCREYDCRRDKRVWIDFEARIPAPPPVHAPPDARPGGDQD